MNIEYHFVRLFACATMAVLSSIAQTTNGSFVDLSAPALAAHADLPQNNPPGNVLTQALTRAKEVANAKSITSSPGIDVITIDEPTAGATPTLVSNMYRRLACSAEAIIIGHPNTWQSHLSSQGTAVYGDYDVSVDTILKDNQITPYIKGDHIVVTRLSGTITLGAGPINQVAFKHEGFPLLQKGTTYLMFLRYVPTTGAFLPIDAFATFTGGASTWTIARKAYAQDSLFSFSRGAFEQTIQQWLGLCGK